MHGISEFGERYRLPLRAKKNTMTKKQIIVRAIVAGLLAALGVVAAAIGLSSCNVTRTITNESQYFQRGDTSVLIQTKTVETYDASKKQ